MDQKSKSSTRSNDESEDEGSEGDLAKIFNLAGVEGNWVGPPVFTAADVRRLAEEAEAKKGDAQ